MALSLQNNSSADSLSPFKYVKEQRKESERRSKLKKSVREEYSNSDPAPISPATEVIVNSRDYKPEIQKNFDVLAQKSGLEVDTKKSKLLTGIAQDMVKDRPDLSHIRVVVMQRSEAPQAFVYPDGTIVLSQSLLESLGSLDEIAAVIAHEVMHVVNKTFVRSNQKIDSFGLSWFHEMASDVQATDLLQKSRFNSTAFRDAIKKISGAERGLIHQSGHTRAAQTVTSHFLVDTETSHQKFIEKPKFLSGEVQATNKEVLQYAVSKHDVDLFSKTLPNLHPSDLISVGKLLDHELHYGSGDRGRAVKEFISKSFEQNDILHTNRWKSAGFGQDEIQLALLSRSESAQELRSTYLFKSFDEIVAFVKKLPEIYSSLTQDRWQRMLESTKNSFSGSESVYLVLTDTLTNICRDAFSSLVSKEKRGFAANKNDFFSLCDAILGLSEAIGDAAVKSHISYLLCFFIEARCIRPEKKSYEYDAFSIQDEEVRSLILLTKEKYQIDVASFPWNYHTDAIGTKQAWDSVLAIVAEIFPRENESLEHVVQKYFSDGLQNIELFAQGLELLRAKLNLSKMSDEERMKIVRKISSLLDEQSFTSSFDILRSLDEGGVSWGGYNNRRSPQEESELDRVNNTNERLARLSRKINTALSLLIKEGEVGEPVNFFLYLEETLSEADIQWAELSTAQITSVVASLLLFIEKSGDRLIHITDQTVMLQMVSSSRSHSFSDFSGLSTLPPFVELLRRQEKPEFSSFSTVIQALENKKKKFPLFYVARSGNRDIFSDNLTDLILFQEEREVFLKLLEKEISPEDYPFLFQFIDTHMPGDAAMNGVLHEIARRYVTEESISLESKVAFILKNYSRIGLECTVLLGDQIHDLETYKEIRQKLGKDRLETALGGSSELSLVAGADYLTSLSSSPYSILNTANNGEWMSKDVSTTWAMNWARLIFRDINSTIVYENGEFQVSSEGRKIFRTLNDVFAELKGLSLPVRLAISQKMLTESNGLLASLQSKDLLAQSLASSLQLPSEGLTPALLSAAIKTGDPDVISFPSSQVLAPLLFRGLNVNGVNTSYVMRETMLDRKFGREPLMNIVNENELEKAMRSPTRELLVFGKMYASKKEGRFFRRALESDQVFRKVTDLLTQKFLQTSDESSETTSEAKTLDQSSESMVRALEAGGATTVRQMQLATQFFEFKPDVKERLSRSLDSNPGMSMLGAWENLYLWSTPNDNDSPERKREKDELAEYLKEIRLEEKLAGGSLNSIFLVTRQDGSKRVLRLQNPNATFFIGQGHKLVENSYLEADKSTRRRHARQVKVGLMLNDLAREWCLADISDPNYIENDADLRAVIAKSGLNGFVVPEIGLTQEKVKEEHVATGITANKFMFSDASPEKKRKVLESVTKFFEEQLKFEKHKILRDGKEYVVVHSDQHLGNYMVSFAEGSDDPQIGVIDRNMCLRLSQREVELITLMITPNAEKRFLSALIEFALDASKIEGVTRVTKNLKVKAKLARGFALHGLRGKSNQLELLQIVFEALSQEDIKIPLQLQLMIRNAGAYQRLKETAETLSS